MWRRIMNMKVLNVVGVIFCLSCLIVSYYCWSMVKNNDKNILQKENVTEKVITYNYNKSVEVEGKVISALRKEYSYSDKMNKLEKDIKLGLELHKGDLLVKNDIDSKNNICSEIDGKVVSLSDSDGIGKIIVEDVDKLFVKFYTPQLYCNDYHKNDEVTLTVNGEEYSALINNIGYEMEERTLENEDGSIDKEMYLYMEAEISNCSNLWVNEIGTIKLMHITAQNTKSVKKTAIKYDENIPYVEVIRGDNVKRIDVELGENDDTMTEIISDQIMVGDYVSL